jgi:S-adenosylmethionine:tRNA ribosyltransferase-isomerase
VIAIGTSTARALEGNALNTASCAPRAAVSVAQDRQGVRAARGRRHLTGMHAAGTSHFELLQAFASRTLLSLAWSHAEDIGYLAEEFGDADC